MSEATYKIRMFKWRTYQDLNRIVHFLKTPVWTWEVWRDQVTWMFNSGAAETTDAESLRHGKDLCEQEYRRRVLACLIPVEGA